MIYVARNSDRIHAVITIHQYIDSILLSKARRSIYHKYPNIPLKYQNPRYIFKEGFLIDTQTNTKVIKNSRSAGKPRYMKICGQDLWTGINHNLRSKLAREIKVFFYQYFRNLTPITDLKHYPLGIGLEFYDVDDGGDIDNMEHLYRKCITDALCGNVEFIKNQEGKYTPDRKKYHSIIIDDSKRFVSEMWTKFHIINDHEKRFLTILIYSA